MIEPVFSRIYKLEFVLNVALIILLLERLNDFGVFFLFVLFVHVFDILLEELFVLLVGLAI